MSANRLLGLRCKVTTKNAHTQVKRENIFKMTDISPLFYPLSPSTKHKKCTRACVCAFFLLPLHTL